MISDERVKEALELYDTVTNALGIASLNGYEVDTVGLISSVPGPVQVRDYIRHPLEVKIIKLTKERNELLRVLHCVRGDWRHLKCISKTTSDEVDRVISKVMS